MSSAIQFVPTPEALLQHPDCPACGECLFCGDPHRCPAVPSTLATLPQDETDGAD